MTEISILRDRLIKSPAFLRTKPHSKERNIWWCLFRDVVTYKNRWKMYENYSRKHK